MASGEASSDKISKDKKSRKIKVICLKNLHTAMIRKGSSVVAACTYNPRGHGFDSSREELGEPLTILLRNRKKKKKKDLAYRHVRLLSIVKLLQYCMHLDNLEPCWY